MKMTTTTYHLTEGAYLEITAWLHDLWVNPSRVPSYYRLAGQRCTRLVEPAERLVEFTRAL